MDPLTGLLNRMLIFDRMRQAVALAQRNSSSVSVILIDLDGFKGVNDSMGHEMGDNLLQAVDRQLQSSARETDSVARLGGDEFLIVAPHHSADSSTNALSLPMSILQSLENLLVDGSIQGHTIDLAPLVDQSGNGTRGKNGKNGAVAASADGNANALSSITCSVGVAQFPIDGDDVEELYRKADTALYSAKRRGGNQVAFYSDRLQDEARLRDVQRLDLLKGIDQGAFVPYYQPIVAASDSTLHG